MVESIERVFLQHMLNSVLYDVASGSSNTLSQQKVVLDST